VSDMKRSSDTGLAWLALAGVLLLGGHVAAGAQAARVGREFKIKVGGVVTLDGGSLRLRFVRVAEDSRCPADVDCVWAGNAEVLVEAGGKGWKGKTTLKLDTNESGQGASEARYGRYTLKLLALSPERRRDLKIAPGQYTATLLVVKD
jgi:hypothetical protein